MKTKVSFFALLLCVGALFAQRGSFDRGNRPGGAGAEQLKAYLGLSDQQLQDLTGVQKALRETMAPLMQQMMEKSKALREAASQDPVDEALTTQLKTEIAALRAQESELRAQYRTQALGLLTGEQNDKLATLQQAMKLVPVAQQATFLNLLESPGGFERGFGGPGFRGSKGPGGSGQGAPRPRTP